MIKPPVGMPLLALVLAASAIAPMAGARPAAAQAAKTIDVPALRTLIAGLGLEDIGDKSTYVAVGGQGSSGYVIDFTPSADKSYVAVYARWTGVPKDRLPALPALKMLEYNNTHDFMFSVGADKDDGKAIVLEHDFSAQAVTPQVMRKAIDDLVAAADETADLWNPDKWTPAGEAKAAR